MRVQIAPRVDRIATPASASPASRVARYRATLAVIDRAHDLGKVLAQEEAADLVDAAIGTYFAHLSATEPTR